MITLIIYWFVTTSYTLGMLETFEKNNRETVKEKILTVLVCIVLAWFLTPYSFGVDFAQSISSRNN